MIKFKDLQNFEIGVPSRVKTDFEIPLQPVKRFAKPRRHILFTKDFAILWRGQETKFCRYSSRSIPCDCRLKLRKRQNSLPKLAVFLMILRNGACPKCLWCAKFWEPFNGDTSLNCATIHGHCWRRSVGIKPTAQPSFQNLLDIKNFWTKFCPNLTILVSLESWRRDLSKFGKTKLNRSPQICQNRKFGFRVKDPKFGFELGLRIWNFRFSRNSNFDKKTKFRHGGLS